MNRNFLLLLGLLVLASPPARATRSMRSAPITWQSWVHWTGWAGPVGVGSQSTYYRSLTLSLANVSAIRQSGTVTFIIGSETDHICFMTNPSGDSFRAQGRMFFRFINPDDWFDYSGPWAPVLMGASGGAELSSADTRRSFDLDGGHEFVTTFSVHLTQPPTAIVSWGATNDIGALAIKIDVDQDRGALAAGAMFRAMVGGGVTIYHPPQGASTEGDWRGEITSAAYTPIAVTLNGGRPF